MYSCVFQGNTIVHLLHVENPTPMFLASLRFHRFTMRDITTHTHIVFEHTVLRSTQGCLKKKKKKNLLICYLTFFFFRNVVLTEVNTLIQGKTKHCKNIALVSEVFYIMSVGVY